MVLHRLHDFRILKNSLLSSRKPPGSVPDLSKLILDSIKTPFAEKQKIRQLRDTKNTIPGVNYGIIQLLELEIIIKMLDTELGTERMRGFLQILVYYYSKPI